MKYIRAIMIVYTLAKIKESEMTTLSNKKINLWYHDYDKTWNEAHEVCKLQGSSLYIEDSAERAIVLQKYRDEWNTNNEVWIGLVYPSVATDSLFAWTNCFWLDNTYDRYKSGEPDNTDTDKCILSRDDGWKSEKCSRGKKFVCETPGADCTFNKTTGIPLNSPSFTTITISTFDESLCETECMTRMDNNTNCWGLNFNNLNDPGNCTLYFTTNPFFFTSTATYDNSNVTMSIKICYKYASVEKDNFTHIVNNSDIPVEECTSYFDSATTTTAVPPTTTTAAPSTTTTTAPPTTTTTSTTTSTPTTATTTSTTTSTVPSTTTTATPSVTTTSVPPTTTSTSTTSTAQTTTTITTPPSTTTTEQPTSAPTTTTTTPLTTTSAPSTATSGEQTASTVSTSTSANINSASCNCQCSDLSTLLGNYTSDPDWKNLTVAEKVELLVTRLRVDKRNLSSFVRKKTSAPDDRAVSVSVGYLAMSFISIIFGLIIVSDGINFLKYLTKNKTHSEDNVSVPGLEDSTL